MKIWLSLSLSLSPPLPASLPPALRGTQTPAPARRPARDAGQGEAVGEAQGREGKGKGSRPARGNAPWHRLPRYHPPPALRPRRRPPRREAAAAHAARGVRACSLRPPPLGGRGAGGWPRSRAVAARSGRRGAGGGRRRRERRGRWGRGFPPRGPWRSSAVAGSSGAPAGNGERALGFFGSREVFRWFGAFYPLRKPDALLFT